MMSNKRSHIDIDPDYEDVSDHQAKRQRVLEKDAKDATVRKIECIIRSQFEEEILQKEVAINMVDQRLNQTRLLMDRLRACIVASQYTSTIPGSRDRSQPPSIHPTVKKRLGKAPATVTSDSQYPDSQADTTRSSLPQPEKKEAAGKVATCEIQNANSASSILSPEKMLETRGSRFKIKKKIIIGNVSKFIPVERREVNDQSTHKWMLYVRGSKENPHIESFVKKVWFFLHPSYKPNDLVEITQPPFHLTRRGWGEFPVRVQLHFRDQRNKRVDIIHNLKLDKTCTGLQTLGSETIVEVELEKDVPRSDSPLQMLADSASKSVRLLTSGKGHNSSEMENTTTENVINHSDSTENDIQKAEAMDVDKTDSDVTSVRSPTNGHDAVQGKTIKKLLNGAQNVLESASVFSKENPNSTSKDSTPKVIHLKAKDLLQSDLCKNPVGTDNHSKTGTNSTSAVSPVTKQPGVMYMRCKDQHGNLLLLPYRLGPQQPAGKLATDTSKTMNVEISKDSSASNKSVVPPTPSTSSPPKTVKPVPTTVPQSSAVSGASKPTTTNLVLKVTPTGLKLVPADSEAATTGSTLANPTTPLNQASHVAVRPKLKSLLNTSPVKSGQKPVISQSCEMSAAKSGLQKTANAVITPKQPVSNLKLVNHTVPNVSAKPQQTSPDAANQSLVLANIGDKQYLLKVVQGEDNQVLLVPNKPANTPLSNQNITLGSSANQTKTVPSQKSLLNTSSSGAVSTQSTDKRSLKFSFGLSPFSLQSTTNQKCSLSSQKNASNHVALTSEKKIHVWKKKIRDMFEVTEEVKPLNTSDYPDLLSMIRAAVRRHPVVQEVVDRSQHPYCARSVEEWLSWNIGKRRASEWQRAASVRNFIKSHLKDENSFKGSQLWTTKQIMSWCRLHAFSPHHLENFEETQNALGSCSINTMSDKHTPVSTVQQLSSLSDLQPLQTRLDSLLSDITSSDDSDEDIDILSVQLPKGKVKSEPTDSSSVGRDCEVLPSSDEAVFVQDRAQQIGVKFHPVDIEHDIQGAVTEDTIYAVMSRLAEDILREAYSQTRQQKNKPEDELKAEHVFKAVSNMSVADILTNRHFGIHDSTAPPSGVR